jgi:hypothetical protein
MMSFLNDSSDFRTKWMISTSQNALRLVFETLSTAEMYDKIMTGHSYLEKEFFEELSLRNIPLMILLIAHSIDDAILLESIGGDMDFELIVPIVENLFVSRDLNDEERGHLLRFITILCSSTRIPRSYFVERTNLIETICVLLGMEYKCPFAFHWAIMSMRTLCQDSDEVCHTIIIHPSFISHESTNKNLTQITSIVTII